ncbi:hypothetical protein EHQ53_13975 [Leptospira langatensis]|uniref:Uncharacterized protein n=1 Tax=Leptospira langatensis TaxID=2484983 RepID=A0ABY2M982_9LEPT|nr:hypothetical protein [Leptospira langatensis]TGL39625.1 hypothetical protein EHQ53_13975 [Leptospira langatensis]
MISQITGADIVPYFKVSGLTSGGTPFKESDWMTRIQSFKVSEKEREALVGELEVVDDTGLVNKLFRYGFPVDLEWGIKNVPTLTDLFSNEIDGSYKRFAKCSVVNTSYNMSEGIGRLTVSFRLLRGTTSLPRIATYKSGTVEQVIRQAANRIQADVFIDFEKSSEALSNKNYLVQNNITDIAFLRYIAFKYNIKIAYQTSNKDSTKLAIVYFVDWDKQDGQNYAENRGLKGVMHYFDYATAEANIIGGNIDGNAFSPNGSSLVPITTPDGKIQVQFKPSATESTETWELNPDAVRAELQKRGLSDQTALMQEILSAGEQEFLDKLRQQYFKKVIQTTAPEGYGFTAKLDVVFNPNFQIGDLVFMGSEKSPIPPQFKSKKGNNRTLWRITELESKISGGGYSMSVGLGR